MSEKYFNYDQEKYPFVKLITDFYDCNLQELHLTNEIKYKFFSQPGKDSDTIFHKAFYDKMRSNWKDFNETYRSYY